MADEVTIDKATFHNRLSAFISQWKQDKRNGDSLFAGASSIAVVMGKSDESQGFSKTSALQFWLLGYEFPSTVFVITQDSMHIVTTKKKGNHICLSSFPLSNANFLQPPTSNPSKMARRPSRFLSEARMLPRTRSSSKPA
jgi:nucleosome binding factor SPN SPT16 subunit